MSDNEENVSSDEDIKEVYEEINEVIIDNEDDEELTSSIQKPKKARTEKQKLALIKAQETRRKNLKKKKQMEIDNKTLMEENIS